MLYNHQQHTCQFCRNFSYIYSQAYNIEPKLDLRNKSIELIMVADNEFENSIKSIANTLNKVLFNKATIFTSQPDKFILPKSYNITIEKIKPIMHIIEYNSFIIFDLLKYLTYDYFITIQYDGTVIFQDKWINNFMNYDYIGSIWNIDIIRKEMIRQEIPEELWNNYRVGNSGFCMRSKRLLETINQYPDIYKQFIYSHCLDDWFLCTNRYVKQWLIDKGIKFAPMDIAGQFSFEIDSKESLIYNKWFGSHPKVKTHLNGYLKRVKIYE